MFTLDDLLQASGGSLAVPADDSIPRIFHSASIDTRTITSGQLFVAFKGEHTDGHAYIPQAHAAGAAGVLCSRPLPDIGSAFVQVVVPDVLYALQALARYRLARQPQTEVIGITGSSGKTSAKEAVAAVLRRRFSVLYTAGTFNNEIGLPLTILRLEESHQKLVLEMGAQWVGEIAMLCKIAPPFIGIVTTIGPAHLEFFGSIENVAIAKGELVEALPPEGVALLNMDDPNVAALSARTRARVCGYGRSPNAAVRAVDITGDALSGMTFTITYQGRRIPVHSALRGNHSISLALAAASVALLSGMSDSDVAAGVVDYQPEKGRHQILPGPLGTTLIDDSYNANGQSTLEALSTLALGNRSGQRWAILGDMFELGVYAENEHRTVGAAVVGRADHLIAVGDYARFFIEGARHAGFPADACTYLPANVHSRTELREAKEQAATILAARLQRGDVVLIKGSRGMAMEDVVTFLKQRIEEVSTHG